MNKRSPDRATDAKYAAIRARYGRASGRANGYRLHRYFVGEQKLLLELLGAPDGTVLDLACGSGLMGVPLKSAACHVVGLDFNGVACADAQTNGISAVRGDAWSLPFGDAGIDHMFSCQFLNQQPPQRVPQLLHECARVLRPGGRLVLVWRNDSALVHRLAHALYRVVDRLSGRPEFPVYAHPQARLAAQAQAAGFAVTRALVSFPLCGWSSAAPASIAARVFGASAILVLERSR